jgi:multicomponent Na+:H+ antiporter subunit D
MLAGVVKKVGVYAIVRLYFTVFAAASVPVSLPGVAGDSFLAFFGPVFFVMATASIVLGGVAAVGRPDLDGLLAHSSISQVGFIVLPLALAATVPAESVRVIGVTAALVYSFNHALAKSLLFLVSGTLKESVGTDEFARLGGLANRAPVLAGTFLLGALTLIGVPPLSGFFGKLLVFQAGADAFATGAAGAGAFLAVALSGAILTIAYYTRAWNAAFWGEPSDLVRAAIPSRWVRGAAGGETEEGESGSLAADGGLTELTLTTEVTMAVVLAVCLVAFGVGFEAVYATAEAAARAALDTGTYVDSVGPEVFSG